jgi:threonine/homoserine/homoserine lactone efflux protein
MIVKYAGALYLVYLGVQVLRTSPSATHAATVLPARLWPILRDGFVVALLNPKTALFFAAFLPQFVNADASPLLQSITLGALFVVMAVITDTVYALAASVAAPALAHARGIGAVGRYLTGGAFISLGVFTALAGSRSGK